MLPCQVMGVSLRYCIPGHRMHRIIEKCSFSLIQGEERAMGSHFALNTWSERPDLAINFLPHSERLTICDHAVTGIDHWEDAGESAADQQSCGAASCQQSKADAS